MDEHRFLNDEDALWHRMDGFHRTRVESIARHSGLCVDEGKSGLFVIHLIPEASLRSRHRFSAADLKAHGAQIYPFGTQAGDARFNSDGFLRYYGRRQREAYSQLFRDGRVEGAMAGIAYAQGKATVLRATFCEEALIDLVERYLTFCKAIGLATPIWLFAAMSGCEGARIKVDRQFGDLSESSFDRDLIFYPDERIESFDAEPARLVRPLCDCIWQSAGIERSPHFDNDGRWTRPR